jgi:hypothetical protein
MRREIHIPEVLAADQVPAIPIQTGTPGVLAPQAEVTGALPDLPERIEVQEAADLPVACAAVEAAAVPPAACAAVEAVVVPLAACVAVEVVVAPQVVVPVDAVANKSL